MEMFELKVCSPFLLTMLGRCHPPAELMSWLICEG